MVGLRRHPVEPGADGGIGRQVEIALVGEVGPVRATTITYLNPAVAVIAGAVILGEPVTVWTVVGFVLVVTGSYLVNRGGPPQPAAGTELAGETSSSCA